MKNVVSGNLDAYTLSTYVISSAKAAHPWGTWLLYKGTIYYSHQSGIIGVPSYDIFKTNGGNSNYVLPANTADIEILNQASSTLPLLQNNDTRLY